MVKYLRYLLNGKPTAGPAGEVVGEHALRYDEVQSLDAGQIKQLLDNLGGGGLLPVGTRLLWGSENIPAGFEIEDGAVIPVSEYSELVAVMYCGDANNATAGWYYRCTNPSNPTGSRSTTGDYFVLANPGSGRGDFYRALASGRSLWKREDATKIPWFRTTASSLVLPSINSMSPSDYDEAIGSGTYKAISTGTAAGSTNYYFTPRVQNAGGIPIIKY